MNTKSEQSETVKEVIAQVSAECNARNSKGL